jgi:hypothetical protein
VTDKKSDSEAGAKGAPPVAKTAAKVFDVSHPGKTAAHAAGRPVIVGHTSMIKEDPMVSAAPPPETANPAKRTEIVITPPEDEPEAVTVKSAVKPPAEAKSEAQTAVTKPEEPTKPDEPAAAEASKPADMPPAEAVVPNPEVTPDEDPAAKPDDEPAKAVDESADDSEPRPATDPKNEDGEKQSAEEAQKAAAIQELIDSKKYVVPINTVKQRQTKWIVAFVLFLLVMIGFTDLAMDADYIKISGVTAPTHFFEDKTLEPVQSKATKPESQLDSYTSTADGATFQYPKSWKLTKAPGTLEYASIEPSDAALSTSGEQGIFLLSFSRDLSNQATSTSKDAHKIVDVTYQKLPDTTAGIPIYLQTFIVETKISNSTRYLIYLNLSNTNSLKVGDVVSGGGEIIKKPLALDANGTDQLTFGGELVPYGSDGKVSGPLSLAEAQKFLKDSQTAKDAQSALLSFKVPAKK